MIVWDGGRCVEGFCLADRLPDGLIEPAPDDDGGADLQIGPELKVSLADGRITTIQIFEVLVFQGEQLIGQEVEEVARLLFDSDPEREEFLLPNGAVLSIVSGRRRDFELQLWAWDDHVQHVDLQDFDWIED